MTRERKIYAAVLVLAVIALGANQFVFGPPATRAAAASSPLVQAGPRAKSKHKLGKAIPAAAGLPDMAALQRRMDQVSRRDGLDVNQTFDVFRPPAGWVKAKAAQQDSSISDFTSKHHLVAVLTSNRGGMAVVAGASRRSLRVGEILDGFKLIAVGERSATFSSAQGNIELALPTDASSDAQISVSAGR